MGTVAMRSFFRGMVGSPVIVELGGGDSMLAFNIIDVLRWLIDKWWSLGLDSEGQGIESGYEEVFSCRFRMNEMAKLANGGQGH